jgi:phage terminase small subunit
MAAPPQRVGLPKVIPMAGRGFPPASKAEKLAKGETRPSRVNYDEPVHEKPSSLAAPKGLTGAGLKEWTAQIDRLVQRGVVTDADMTAFTDYCFRIARLDWYRKKEKQAGPELAIAKGYTGAVLKTEASVDRLRDRLGLTPVSRSSVKAKPGKPPASDKPVDLYLRAIPGGRTS